MLPWVGDFQGCSRDKQRNNWRCARAAQKRPQSLFLCKARAAHENTAMESTVGKSADLSFEVYHATLAEIVDGSGCGVGSTAPTQCEGTAITGTRLRLLNSNATAIIPTNALD